VYDDLARTVTVIHRTTGVRPRWVRAPYGVFSGPSLLAARRLGLTPVLWTCWGADWTRRATPASVAATVRRGLHGGATILLHDSDIAAVPGSWRSALGALPTVLAQCRDLGVAVGPLREHGIQEISRSRLPGGAGAHRRAAGGGDREDGRPVVRSRAPDDR
jgi:peptidoglycan/xylan/chitin deacetylase (PgdA/CDA1 family)